MARYSKKEGIEEEVKRKYLLCPFCQNKQYETHSRDETAAWCEKCGKCFTVNFVEEDQW